MSNIKHRTFLGHVPPFGLEFVIVNAVLVVSIHHSRRIPKYNMPSNATETAVLCLLLFPVLLPALCPVLCTVYASSVDSGVDSCRVLFLVSVRVLLLRLFNRSAHSAGPISDKKREAEI